MATAERFMPDTCAWIDFFNARSTSLAVAVEGALRHGVVHTCGVIKFELVQGIKGQQEQSLFFDAFKAVEYLEMDDDLWISCGHLSRNLRQKGITLPLSDILIAILALKHNLTVLTIDRHFNHVEGLRCSTG